MPNVPKRPPGATEPPAPDPLAYMDEDSGELASWLAKRGLVPTGLDTASIHYGLDVAIAGRKLADAHPRLVGLRTLAAGLLARLRAERLPDVAEFVAKALGAVPWERITDDEKEASDAGKA